MATKTNVRLTEEMYYAIEEALESKGYYAHEEVYPPREIVTDVICPICDENLNFIQAGLSYQIKCPTENCADVSVRGI